MESIIKGEALFDLHRYDEAQQEFTRALTYSNTVKDILLMGDVFTVNGNLKMSKEAYTKALTLDPDNMKASKALQRVATLENNSRKDDRIGYSFYKEGQRIAAIDNLRKATALNSVDPIARWMLAEAYRKEKFYNDAIDEYKAYLAFVTNDKEKYVKKARKHIKKLQDKVADMKEDGDPLKKYTEYIQTNRRKY